MTLAGSPAQISLNIMFLIRSIPDLTTVFYPLTDNLNIVKLGTIRKMLHL
jgi:hypothetical protein